MTRATIGIAALAGVLALVLPASQSGAAPHPLVVVQPTVQSPGSSVKVIGQNLPPNTNVQVQICGNDALNGSGDCALSTAQEVTTSNEGLFQTSLIVSIPPKPCPCVVLLLDFSTPVTPMAPIDIIGAPFKSPSATNVQKLQIVNAYLTGSGPWSSWFGAPPQRTLVISIRNPNAAPYADPPLQLSVGAQADTTSNRVTTYRLSTIGPHQTKTYEVRVTFPAFSIGEHEVVGTVGGVGLSRTLVVNTWLFPWGLLVVLVVLIEVVLLSLTRFIRERRRRREAEGQLDLRDQGPSTEETVAVGAVVGAGVGAPQGSPLESPSSRAEPPPTP